MIKKRKVLGTNDIFVQYLFARDGFEPLLKNFINAVLTDKNHKPIKKVFLKNRFNIQNFREDKLTILDIKAVDEDENWYDIEVQTEDHKHFDKRILYYLARIYSNQLQEGDDWGKLHNTIAIVLTRFDCHKKEVHTTYTFRDDAANEEQF